MNFCIVFYHLVSLTTQCITIPRAKDLNINEIDINVTLFCLRYPKGLNRYNVYCYA